MESHTRIFDTTLRDGEQTAGVHFSAADKVAIAKALEDFGVSTVEAGFPISSPGEHKAVEQVARAVGDVEIAALARCREFDIDAAAEAVAPARHPVVHVFCAVSDIHIRHKFRMSREEVLASISHHVAYARDRAAVVQFSAEDATRADRDYLMQCVRTAVDAGASRINIPDTVGAATPDEYGDLIGHVVDHIDPEIVVSVHCHNDMGLATANSVAAVKAGARQVEGTINGIGERAGNTALEEVVVVLALKEIARTGVDCRRIQTLSERVACASGVAVQPNRAIVGANAFAHSSGIHQDGILKHEQTYTFVPPAFVGAHGHAFRLTARSGRNGVAHAAAAMGVVLTRERLEDVYAAFIAAADAHNGEVPDDVFARIVQGTTP